MKEYKNICVDTLELQELQTLIDNNLKFRDYVHNEYYERECDFLNYEILSSFPAYYEYSCVYTTKVNLSSRYYGGGVKWDDLIEWINEVEKDYCFFGYFENKKTPLELAKQGAELQEKLDIDYDTLSDLNYNRIEKKVDEIQKELENIIKNAIDLFLDFPDDTDFLKNELECLCDNNFFSNLFFDESGKLYTTAKHYI